MICHRIAVGKQAVSFRPSAAWSVVPLDWGVDLQRVGPLVLACSADSRAGPRVSLAGLRAELAGRAGRTAAGFVARSSVAGPDAEFVGLAVVIEAIGAQGPRFSLAWLLVHPASRRAGVASALLEHALAHARSRGGETLCVETLSAWPDAVAFWGRMAAGRIPP